MGTFDYRNQGDAVELSRLDAPAIIAVDEHGARPVTFRQFARAAAGVAERLRREGFAVGERVALLGPNSPEWLVAFYGAQRAGLVPVPISAKLPPDGVDFVLEDSGATALFTDAELPIGSTVRRFPLAPLLDEGSAATAEVESFRPAGDEPAMILYTSGSTGRPKGVVLSHRSHLWVQSLHAGTAANGTRSLVAAPLHHMNALANCQAALSTGAGIILLPSFDARLFLRAAARHRATRVTGVPPMFAMLLAERELIGSVDLSSVVDVFLGSAPASDALIGRVRALFPHATVHFGYGTTESGPVAFTDHPDGLATPDGSVGVADPHVDLRLVDADGAPAPVDAAGTATGVLEIRCPALMSGYHRRPDVPDPITADGYYHTKDVFRRDPAGFHFFVGREDDMFVSGGENVYPLAVERLLERFPAVAQASVVPVPDEVKSTKPVAFVVLRAEARSRAGERLEEEIKRFVLAHVEPFAHPRRIWFVDALPLSAANKIDRRRLQQEALRRSTAGTGRRRDLRERAS